MACTKCGSNETNLQNAGYDVYEICIKCKHQELRKDIDCNLNKQKEA